MNLRLRPAILIAFVFSVLLLSATTKAEENLVEIRGKEDVYRPYRDRRRTNGWQFAANYENYQPKEFISSIDGQTYGDMFGNANIGLTSLETGYKFNFSAGSISALAGYGMGTLQDNRIGETRVLSVVRPSARAMYILDALFPEPYVAPYGAFGVTALGIDEKISETGDKFSGQAKMGTTLTIGALIQVNWLEDDVSRTGYLQSGVQNTYIDFFLTQYSKSGGENDPNTATVFNWGAGLRLEF